MSERAPDAIDVVGGPQRSSADVALPINATPARYPGRWLTALACLFLVGCVVDAFVASPNIKWAEVASYFLSQNVLRGLWLTVVLTIAAQSVGIVGGVILASMSMSLNPVLRTISSAYIWLFRGTPALIQIIFWFNIGLVFPHIALRIPATGIGFHVETNTIITPIMAAVTALGLNEAAYMSEIVRGGIISIDRGQSEAAVSIGLTHAQSMRYVILPQAIRTIIPPTANEFISMLKNTSLVSVISAKELLTSVQEIYASNFLTIELLIVASIWYLIMTTIATIVQKYLEQLFDRGSRRSGTGASNLFHRLFRRGVSVGPSGPGAL
jgi:polar amino acid transport system permease protein